MKELEKLKTKYPGVSDIIIMRRYVQGRNFTYDRLKYLMKHVSKADYPGIHKNTVIEWLREATVKNSRFANT